MVEVAAAAVAFLEAVTLFLGLVFFVTGLTVLAAVVLAGFFLPEVFLAADFLLTFDAEVLPAGLAAAVFLEPEAFWVVTFFAAGFFTIFFFATFFFVDEAGGRLALDFFLGGEAGFAFFLRSAAVTLREADFFLPDLANLSLFQLFT